LGQRGKKAKNRRKKKGGGGEGSLFQHGTRKKQGVLVSKRVRAPNEVSGRDGILSVRGETERGVTKRGRGFVSLRTYAGPVQRTARAEGLNTKKGKEGDG